MGMEIRKATVKDLDAVAAVEAACFPPAEAATREQLARRLAAYGGHFLLLFDAGRLVGFIDGMVTEEKDLADAMYDDETMHREDGPWQMIFGLNTVPDRRREGIAARLMEAFIAEARREGRSGVVLTCKAPLIPYYARFGFADEGVSRSEHGGVVWHQMRLVFPAADPRRALLDDARRTIGLLRDTAAELRRRLEEARTHLAGDAITAEALHQEIRQMRASLAERDARIAALEAELHREAERRRAAEAAPLSEDELALRLQYYYRDFLRVDPKRLGKEDAERLYEVLKYLFGELRKSGLVVKEK